MLNKLVLINDYYNMMVIHFYFVFSYLEEWQQHYLVWMQLRIDHLKTVSFPKILYSFFSTACIFIFNFVCLCIIFWYTSKIVSFTFVCLVKSAYSQCKNHKHLKPRDLFICFISKTTHYTDDENTRIPQICYVIKILFLSIQVKKYIFCQVFIYNITHNFYLKYFIYSLIILKISIQNTFQIFWLLFSRFVNITQCMLIYIYLLNNYFLHFRNMIFSVIICHVIIIFFLLWSIPY